MARDGLIFPFPDNPFPGVDPPVPEVAWIVQIHLCHPILDAGDCL